MIPDIKSRRLWKSFGINLQIIMSSVNDKKSNKSTNQMVFKEILFLFNTQ